MSTWKATLAKSFRAAGPLLSAATLVVAEELNLTLAEAGQATAGWQTFGVGVGQWSYLRLEASD